jgi:RNA polymerase sigma-54 factor
MALEQKLNLKMSQKLIMTPSLQQAIKLLQLSKLELLEEITHELVENPVLEEGTEVTVTEREEKEQSPSEKEETPPAAASESNDGTGDETFDDAYLDAVYSDYLEHSYEPRVPMEEIELPSFEATLTKPQTLTDHLMWQLEASPMDDRLREVTSAPPSKRSR